MGAFFTNLHARASAEAVERWLDATLRREGLRPAAEGEAPDRSVVLVQDGEWLSVYDEGADVQDTDLLDRHGQGLSEALGGDAFSVLVHDSDVLLLALYRQGKRIDRYDSNRRGSPEPHLEAWAPLLRDPDAMREALTGEPLMAEAALRPLGRAINVDPGRLRVGYRYLVEEGVPAGAVTLRYRLVARPAWEKPAEGAPRLHTDWEVAPPVVATVGADLLLSLTTRNTGGAGTGVVVRVEGGEDVARWTEAQFLLGDPRRHKHVMVPIVDGHAELSDAEVPAGRGMPTDPRKIMEARFASQVHVNVRGTATATGTARVRVSLAPVGGEGASVTTSIDVRSTEDRPLKAPPAIHPTMLEGLRKQDVLVGLVLLEPEVARERAAAIVAAMQPHVSQTGKVTTVRYRGGMLEPKQSTGKAPGFLTGKRWANLLNADDATQVDADWNADWGRISFGRGLIPSPNAVHALSIGLPAGDVAEADLREAIDRAVEAGGVLQALLVRWGQQGTLDITPYEAACGLHGQCTLERAWVERWLRGIGPGTLWLGEAMATGPRRIEVTDVRAAEQALADLLPSAADWQQGMAARYRF